MTLLVRDEEELVGANLEFHLAHGVDHVVVTDNGSVDATPDLLAAYADRAPVTVVHEPTHDYSQYRWVTAMARRAARDLGADWVINNDADEFWLPDGPTYGDVLGELPPTTFAVEVARHNMTARRSGGTIHDLVLRPLRSTSHLGGPLGPKTAHRAHPRISVLQGNHEIEWPGTGTIDPEPRLEILHYPIRTRRQFEQSVVHGGRAYARNDSLDPRTGDVRRALYERWQAGEFAALWSELVPDDDEIERLIASGDLVVDRRLADALAGLDPIVPEALARSG